MRQQLAERAAVHVVHHDDELVRISGADDAAIEAAATTQSGRVRKAAAAHNIARPEVVLSVEFLHHFFLLPQRVHACVEHLERHLLGLGALGLVGCAVDLRVAAAPDRVNVVNVDERNPGNLVVTAAAVAAAAAADAAAQRTLGQGLSGRAEE